MLTNKTESGARVGGATAKPKTLFFNGIHLVLHTYRIHDKTSQTIFGANVDDQL